VIATWSERGGAVDCRPLRCFAAMRDELSRVSSQFEREFGAVRRIRGSLHFGPVIVGEIGDLKRAIAFNGDVMNTAARLRAQPQHGWRLPGVPRGDGTLQRNAAVCGSRPRAAGYSRARRRDRCGRHRGSSSGLILVSHTQPAIASVREVLEDIPDTLENLHLTCATPDGAASGSAGSLFTVCSIARFAC
jgi:hypothetical protein